jgi:hypothetical protein
MRRYLPLCLFFTVVSIFYFHKISPQPRKPGKEVASALSKKAGAFIDVNAPAYVKPLIV